MDLVGEAMDLPEAQREDFVRRACPGSSEQVEALSLLRSLGRAQGFMAQPTSDDRGPGMRDIPGSVIGRYRLLEQIGEGGFGAVFMAEQREPVQRLVAVKIIKLGMDTKSVIARFEAERQALALMDHPNIAKVLDAGATPEGRPYFVMELVKGEPITQYCDQNGLNITERLELFAQVCRAVQHAHSKGIIHRDLKPTNVLVGVQDGRARARVIDFGIAKATDRRLTEKTLFTEFRQLIGTPEYMSPEQASGGVDIDTRTDVYSLGVLLYELLTGQTPFDAKMLRSAAFAEMQRIIREEEPEAPSTRLSKARDLLPAVAARRRLEPQNLNELVRGELDWIVLRAIEKDRSRRYESAGNFAADVERFLSGQAVEAAPPSRAYRVRTFVRRHRTGVLAAGLVLAALVGGLGIAVWQAAVASRERHSARLAAEEAQAARDDAEKRRAEIQTIADFQASQLRGVDLRVMGNRLRDDLLASARQGMARAKLPESEIESRQAQLAALMSDANLADVSRRTLDSAVLSRAADAARASFPDQPLVRAGLLVTIGDTMARLGLTVSAATNFEEGIELRRRLLGNSHAETLSAEARFATILGERGELQRAEDLLRDVLARQRQRGPEGELGAIDALSDLSLVLRRRGNFAEAERLTKEVVEARERLHGPDDARTLGAVGNLGLFLFGRGRHEESEACFRRAVEGFTRLRGEHHVEVYRALENLGIALRNQDKLQDAEAVTRRALDGRRALQGDDHPDTIRSLANLGDVLQRMERYDESIGLIRDAAKRRQKALGDEHSETLESIQDLGVVLHRAGRDREAEPVLRRAILGFERTLGAGSPHVVITRLELGHTLLSLARFPEAEVELLAVDKALGHGHSMDGSSGPAHALIQLYEAWDKAEPGKGYDAKARSRRDALPPPHAESTPASPPVPGK